MASNYPAGVTDNDLHFNLPNVEDDEEPELPEHWYFTFGFDHTHPVTGESLAGWFVVIEGDVNSSRELMVKHFGLQWAMQYPTAEAAGVVKYRLKQLPFTQPAPEAEKGQE